MGRRNHLVLGLLMSFGLAACQDQTSNSSAESLDNAAQGSGSALVENQCGPTLTDLKALPAKVSGLNTEAFLSAPDDATRLAALSALQAAPATLLRILFNGLHAKVVVTAQAPSLCQATPFSAEERQIAGTPSQVPSCWLAPTKDQPLRLVLSPDAKLIRFSMLRLMAFAYTEYLVTKLSDPAAPAPLNSADWQEALGAFAATNAKLATKFLGEVHDKTTHDGLSAARAQNGAAFGFMVYANAVDSYYCSTASKAAFTTQFPQTYAAFTDLSDKHSPLSQLGE